MHDGLCVVLLDSFCTMCVVKFIATDKIFDVVLPIKNIVALDSIKSYNGILSFVWILYII